MKIMKVLDLFSGGGGASMGIHQALNESNIEHEIIGIDYRPFLRNIYPFKFVCLNALNIKTEWMEKFDLIWASPPCQKFSSSNYINKYLGRTSNWKDLIAPIRVKLLETKKPFVIENVWQAPLRRDLVLCGTMFDLGVFRHRIFEIEGFVCYQPVHPDHNGHIGDGTYFSIHRGPMFKNRGPKWKEFRKKHHNFQKWKDAMGVDWIPIPNTTELPKMHPLTEAIPPAYSKYITQQFLKKYISLEKWIKQK